MHNKILSKADSLRDSMVETLTRLCRIPAVSPHNGGKGEEDKINELRSIINDELGLSNKAKIHIERVNDSKSPT
ncbi:MAG: hypothetical protein IJR35_03905, partial [Synergistaceae bacterium]|nr:hypothetical protein [Synergistaceae bacterium]